MNKQPAGNQQTTMIFLTDCTVSSQKLAIELDGRGIGIRLSLYLSILPQLSRD